MNPLQPTEGLLLDYLYGLLDDEDRQQVEELLTNSAEWQAALDEAKQQQSAIATAAKTTFADVSFEPPVKQSLLRKPASTQVQKVPLRQPRLGWSLAAGFLLLIVGGGSLGGGLSWYSYYSDWAAKDRQYAGLIDKQNNLNKGINDERDAALAEMRRHQEQIKSLEAKWRGEIEKVENDVDRKRMQVIVTGPQTIHAGARNEYHIETRRPMRNRQTVLAPSQVKVQVIDPSLPENKKVLYQTSVENEKGSCCIQLPRDLPVKAGKQLKLQVVALGKAGVKAQIEQELPLVGRLFLTHLSTDRPMYRPGETIHFRSLTLDRFSLKPPKGTLQLLYTIKGPKGNKVYEQRGTSHLTAKTSNSVKASQFLKGPDNRPITGIGAGQFKIPDYFAGGEYSLEVRELTNKFPVETRKFLINRYQAPRMNKELKFTRKSYGPGDKVTVQCKVEPVAGGRAISGQPVRLKAFVDGQSNPFTVATGKTGSKGEVSLSFALPKSISKGGTVVAEFTDGGNRETLVRPIPIVLNSLLIDFYPEGGDLIAGVANRVYFEVRAPSGKPAEMKGRIVDQDDKVVARILTLNDDEKVEVNRGMGTFRFTPRDGNRYQLKVDSPIGIKSKHILPLPKSEGVALSIPGGVVTDKIDLVLNNVGKKKDLVVGAYCRGRLIAHKRVENAGQETRVSLKLNEPTSGVYRVTVFEERPTPNRAPELLPTAERLIWRRPAQKLNFKIETDKSRYSPGDPVKVKIVSSNENGKSTPAIVLMSVVDKSIIKLADDKTARSMPAHYYLTTEVKNPEELEYADFLVGNHPKAEAALDLLLGTQGWRRFVEQDPKLHLKKRDENVDRLLLVNGLSEPAKKDLTLRAKENIDAQYAPKWEKQQAKVAVLEQTNEVKGKELNDKNQSIKAEIQHISVQKSNAAEALREQQWFLFQIGMPVVSGLLLLVGVVLFVVGIMRSSREQGGGALILTFGVMSILLFLAAGGCSVVFLAVSRYRAERFDHVGLAMNQPVMEQKAEMPNVAPMDPAAQADNAQGLEKMGGAEAAAPNAPMPPPAAPGGGLPVDVKAPAAKGLKPLIAPGIAPGARGPQADKKAPKLNVRQRPNANKKAQAKLGQQMDDKNDVGFKDGPRRKRPPMPGDGKGGFGGRMALELQDAFRRGRGLKAEQQLRAQHLFRQLARVRLDRQVVYGLSPQPIPFVVREYAHKNKRTGDAIRRDFSETLYWHPVLVLPDGKAEVAFDLSDSVTTFRVLAWGHSLDGRLGAAKADIVSKLPFSVEPKLPIEVTNNDEITIPVTVSNETDKKRSMKVSVTANNLKLTSDAQQSVQVGVNGKGRALFSFRPSLVEGDALLLFAGSSRLLGSDSVERGFKIVPEGFPQNDSKSDVLEGVASHSVTLPKSWVKGSLKMQVTVYPSTLADLQKGLEGLLREPYGCFEQTSSSNYPNVMILSYLKESEQTAPEIEKRARRLLDKGYNRLTSYECRNTQERKKRGYEWFGGTAPPHEALTAYGLLQFGDMSDVGFAVDKEMLVRTEKYLLGQRDGNGGFKRNSRALDSFGRAPQHITEAYIIWALTEHGTKEDISKELGALEAKAADSKDPYFLSLVGLGLHNAGKGKEAVDVFKKIRDLQKNDGHLEGAKTSITSSRGRTLHIETTALALMGWLKVNRPGEFNQAVQKAAKWIGQQRSGGGAFGSTQSTILALKALIAYTRENRKTAEAGELTLTVNGKKLKPLQFAAGQRGELTIDVPNETLFKPGANDIQVDITGKNAFPYTLGWSYNTLKPANAKNCPVNMTASLDRNNAKEGETVRLTAKLENVSGEGQGMTMAILGLPAGLSIPEDMKQLRQKTRLQENGTKPGEIGAFEIRGRELILYWRDMGPDQKREVTVDLVCRIPGRYRGPASRAYLYYQSDLKHWSAPLEISIAPAD